MTPTPGHHVHDFQLGNILSANQLQEIQRHYYHWRLAAVSFTLRVINYKNLFKFTDAGASLANTMYKDAGSENMNCDLFGAFYRCAAQQDNIYALNPSTAENFAKILEAGVYQPLRVNGKPITFKWYNTNAYKGVYVDTANPLITATLGNTFVGVVPVNNEPHGMTIMLNNINRYQNRTGDDELSITLELVGSAVIQCKNRKPIVD